MQGRGLRRLDACQASPRSCFPSGTDAAVQKGNPSNHKRDVLLCRKTPPLSPQTLDVQTKCCRSMLHFLPVSKVGPVFQRILADGIYQNPG